MNAKTDERKPFDQADSIFLVKRYFPKIIICLRRIHVTLRINCVRGLIGEWREFYTASASANKMCRARSRGIRQLIRRRTSQAEVIRPIFPSLSSRFSSLLLLGVIRTLNILNSTQIVEGHTIASQAGSRYRFIFLKLFLFLFPYFCPFLNFPFRLCQRADRCTSFEYFRSISQRITITSQMSRLTKDNDILDGTTQIGNLLASEAARRAIVEQYSIRRNGTVRQTICSKHFDLGSMDRLRDRSYQRFYFRGGGRWTVVVPTIG